MRSFAFTLLILAVADILKAFKTENISVTEGETIVLSCSTNLQYPVVWHFRHSGGTQEIFMGGEISKSFKVMFHITGNQSLGEYNLRIPSADNRYAGNYTCIDDDGLGSDLLSIQLNITAVTTTRHMLPIDKPDLDSADYETPSAAANRLQETGQPSNNVGLVAAVCTVLALVVGIGLIVVVVRHKNKRHPTKNTSLYANGSDSCATSKAIKDSNSLTIRDSLQPSRCVSQFSDSSGSSGSSGGSGSSDDPLIRPGREEHV